MLETKDSLFSIGRHSNIFISARIANKHLHKSIQTDIFKKMKEKSSFFLFVHFLVFQYVHIPSTNVSSVLSESTLICGFFPLKCLKSSLAISTSLWLVGYR